MRTHDGGTAPSRRWCLFAGRMAAQRLVLRSSRLSESSVLVWDLGVELLSGIVSGQSEQRAREPRAVDHPIRRSQRVQSRA